MLLRKKKRELWPLINLGEIDRARVISSFLLVEPSPGVFVCAGDVFCIHARTTSSRSQRPSWYLSFLCVCVCVWERPGSKDRISYVRTYKHAGRNRCAFKQQWKMQYSGLVWWWTCWRRFNIKPKQQQTLTTAQKKRSEVVKMNLKFVILPNKKKETERLEDPEMENMFLNIQITSSHK